MSLRELACFATVLSMLSCWAMAAGVGKDVRQLVVGTAPEWDSMRGKIWLFSRASGESAWRRDSGPINVLFGKNGLAWGRGVSGTAEPGRQKEEKDKRAPSGLFALGKIYTYDASLPKGAKYPFHQVGEWDAWVDDPSLPEYNQFVRVNPAAVPPWFEKQKMRHGDFAYRWLIEIRHNSDPPVPGKGSAIFFHIRRGVDRPSAGCTTMAHSDLIELMKWLRADDKPHYALLTKEEYATKWKAWGLPSPDLLDRE